MTRDEKGYVQFHSDWEAAPPVCGTLIDALIAWRQRLHRLGLIGVYPDGIGFGNLSVRGSEQVGFLITGTATGGLPTIGPERVTEVREWDFAANRLRCRGPVQASSESLSHAAVYGCDPRIGAVVHVHQLEMWECLRGRIPTTDPRAEAGTPAMAWAIAALLETEKVRRNGFFVMGGHREGLMAFGADVEEAGMRIVAAYDSFGFSRDAEALRSGARA